MYVGDHYSAGEVLHWTRRDIAGVTLVAFAPTAAYVLLGWHWLAIPWQPVALLGTATAFVVGFKNNASYDRLWEARRIWGAIVNASRAFGVSARDYVQADADVHRVLIHRHLAWLTALRFQLRERRTWEAVYKSYNEEYRRRWVKVEEQEGDVVAALRPWLSEDELSVVVRGANRATQILALQSRHLAALHAAGRISALGHIELMRVLSELLAQQGASERIKNFPYPRQYATMNLWFVQLFVVLLPLGLVQEFQKLGDVMVWACVPFSALVGWVFTTLEKVGESSECPFEGSANDVPITAMSRTIEIDLRQMLGETDVPPPIAASHNILM